MLPSLCVCCDLWTRTVNSNRCKKFIVTTYHQRVTFVGFLMGFVAVLCIGNYYRAKRAMERQRQKRIARLSGTRGFAADSPNSHSTGSHLSDDQNFLFRKQHQQVNNARRRNYDDGSEPLLLDIHDSKPPARVTQV